MSPLESHLRDLIHQNGPISFAVFMEKALYDPEHGFYTAKTRRVGRSGDFFTSVSVGPLFGALLAEQLAQLWHLQNRPPIWKLIEQGADQGLLSRDLLRALQTRHPQCFEALHLWIPEPAPLLWRAQTETLSDFQSKVRWCNSLASLPPQMHGLLCNELLDAFPCHRLQRIGQQWGEIRVQNHPPGGFSWTNPVPPDANLAGFLPFLDPLPESFHAEVCPNHLQWLQTASDKIDSGWLLIIDYGMSHAEFCLPHRAAGTLSAYAQHQRRPSPLERPGEQDLTFHLNFTQLARLALSVGWNIAGHIDQCRFLSALAPGYFESDRTVQTSADLKERLAFRTLTDPNLLGSRFKILGLQKNLPEHPDWLGFRFSQDPRSALGLPLET
jgi:SAM-dependent MidA family methyltransferase